MPVTPFSGSFEPYRPPSVGGFGPRDILNTIIRETGRDISGAARTLAATGGEILDLFWDDIPLTWEDLDARDIQGTAMVGTFVAGGPLAKVLGKTALGAALRGGTWKGRAAFTAGVEGTLGAGFGALRDLSDTDSSRLEAIFKEAGIFATGGAAFSMIGSGYRATIGARRAFNRAQEGRNAVGSLFARLDEARAAREQAGLSLYSADLKQRVGIKLKNNRPTLYRYDPEGKLIDEEGFDTFSSALNSALERGYTIEAGTFRSGLKGVSEDLRTTVEFADFWGMKLDEDFIRQEGLKDLAASAWGNYRAVIHNLSKANGEASSLWAEAAARKVNSLGEFQLTSGERNQWLSLLRGTPQQKARWTDADILRESVKQGTVDLQHIHEGAAVDDLLREISLEGNLPEGVNAIAAANPTDFMLSIRSPNRIAQSNPEFRPIWETIIAREEALNARSKNFKQWYHKLLTGVQDRTKINTAVRILDEASEEASAVVYRGNPISYARDVARKRAKETGDEEVIRLTETLQNRLGNYQLELASKGMLGTLEGVDEAIVEQARSRIAAALSGKDLSETPVDEIIGELLRPYERMRSADGYILDPLGRAISDLLDDAGRAGYFPIKNASKWKVDIFGAPVPKESSTRMFDTEDEARAWAKAQMQKYPGTRATTAGVEFNFTPGETTLSPKQMGELMKRMSEATRSEYLSLDDFAKVQNTISGVPVSRGVGNVASRFLKPRTLGLRQIADNGWESLLTYGYSIERRIAFDGLEREATELISAIPPDKRNLVRFSQNLVDSILGKPTATEVAFQRAAEAFLPGVNPRALQRMSQFIRKWEGRFLLGGPFSALINTTQYVTNAFPVLGTRYAAQGLEAVLSGPKASMRARSTLADLGIDLGFFVPISQDGRIAGFDTVAGQWAQGKHAEAFWGIWMGAFNKSEQWGRMATAWGAYKKFTAEGVRDAGVLRAKIEDVVRRTYFDYSIGDIPEALRGPVGSVIGQFKTYFIKQLEFISSLRGAEIPRFMAALSAAGGLATFFNMPGTDMLALSSLLWSDRKLDESLRLGEWGGLGETGMSNIFERYAVFGLPGATMGLDLSEYIGVGGVADLTRTVIGPFGSDVADFVTFVREAAADVAASGSVSHDTWNATAQKMLPSAVRRAMRGYAVAQSGEVRSPYDHKLIYQPQSRAYTAFVMGVGTPPLEYEMERIADVVVTRANDFYRRTHTRYAKEAALASVEGRNPAEILAEARSAGVYLTPADLKRAVQNLQRSAGERRLRRTPVLRRNELLDLYDLTGSWRNPFQQ